MVILRDGKKLIGVMRSYDQFGTFGIVKMNGPIERLTAHLSLLLLVSANLVFQDTVERIFVGNSFVDVPKGIYLIRGENVVMLGEVVSSLSLSAVWCHSSPSLFPDHTFSLWSTHAQDLYADPPPLLNPINPEQIQAVKAAQEKESEARKVREQRKARVMKAQKGFCEEGAEGDFY